jgi:hypothetical protein
MRNDDPPQIAALGPAPELPCDFRLVFAEREFTGPGDGLSAKN